MASSRFSIEAVVSMIDKVSGPMKKAGNSVSAFSGNTESHFGKLRSTISSFLPMLSLVGFLAFANKAINLFRIQEAAVTNVESAIKATGNAAGISSKQFQDMASALQENSIFGDESILQNVTTQLLTFNQIKGTDVFEKAQVAVADISSRLEGVNASGETLKGISIMLGKVLQDPVGKMDSLARRGIIFSEAEKNTVKSLMAQGKLQQAQLFLLDAISKAGYGGAAKDLAGTSAGKAIQNQNKIGDAMELAGAKLQPLKVTMTNFIVAVLPVLIDLMNSLGKVFEILTPAVEGLKKVFSLIAPLIPPIVFAFIAWKVVTWAVILAQWALKLPLLILNIQIWAAQIAIWALTAAEWAMTAAQWALNAAMSANPIGLLILGIAALIAAGVLLYNNWDTVTAFFSSAWESVKTGFVNAMTSMWEGLKSLGQGILSVLLAPTNLLISGIISLLNLASNIPGVGDKFKAAADWAQGMQNKMNETLGVTTPTQFVQGMASPVSNQIANGGGNSINGRVGIDIRSDVPGTTMMQESLPSFLRPTLDTGLQK